MAQKYREGRLVRQQVPLAGGGPESYVTAYRVAMEEWRIHHALEACTALATECNQLVDVEKPWALAKEPDQSGRLDALLYQLAESLRIIAILLSPVMPVAAAGIRRQLAFEREEGLAEAIWGGLPDGHLVGKPEPLFPRFDLPVS
jgi:methionyl-tRNA synthetase